MIATTHLAAGATVGLWGARLAGILVAHKPPYVQLAVQTGVAFIIGTLSHLVLDAIPHNEFIYKMEYKTSILAVELAIILSIILLIAYSRRLDLLVILFGVVGAAWPDLLSMTRNYFWCNNYIVGSILKIHGYYHSGVMPGPVSSLFLQVLIAVIALMLLV